MEALPALVQGAGSRLPVEGAASNLLLPFLIDRETDTSMIPKGSKQGTTIDANIIEHLRNKKERKHMSKHVFPELVKT